MYEIMAVSAKGQITLPVRVRAQLGIKAGDRIVGEFVPEGLIIKKPLDFFSLRGSIAGGKMPENEEELLDGSAGKSIMART
jgi:AbrB family looped-hinge helix DNA binding protein